MNKRSLLSAAVLCCTVLSSMAERPTGACIEWNAPWPDASLPDAGLGLLPNTEHYTIFAGSRELGMFNHGPIIHSFNDKLFVTWFSHDKYEGAAGTRMLFSFSEDLRTWSKPTAVLDSIGSMADKGALGSSIYGTFMETHGHLYVVAEVYHIYQWDKERTLVPVQNKAGWIARRVYDDGTFGSDTFWLADKIPAGYEDKGIASCLQADDETTRNDLIDLKTRKEERAEQYVYPASGNEEVSFCEPTYYTRPDGKEVGIYRDLSRGLRLYAAVRDQATDPWPTAKKTNIPDSPSKTASAVLPDGSILIVGNFIDKLWQRDPIIIARAKDGIHFDEAYALRAGASIAREKNPGDHKGPGYQYPNITVTADSVWVAYSVSKERIDVTRIPLKMLGADGGLIIGGGFETGNNAGTHPSEGWSYRLANTGITTAEYITEGTEGRQVHTGKRAVAIVNPAGDVDRWYILNARLPEAEAGKNYTFSAWVKTEKMEWTQTHIAMEWLNAEKVKIGQTDGPGISQNQDWAQSTVSGVSPEGTAYVRPVLFAAGIPGSEAIITFDDYELSLADRK